ncbi:hypothetical protein [Anabaena sp. UHCC 0451]|uniref:hypothetical protein n=1 Tax=Anabaena sp. UHCC 0451 TaxID=2055235 RepID=UPI002B22101A|nr:hypothetical protein [Anabaena sp. UHCC 0451]MEA5575529.1 hypothetical protein [Anabaena sp. UHCC 0451]
MTIEFDDNDIILYSAVYLPKDIMSAVFDITIIAWSKVIVNREININSDEPIIAGCLGRAMTKEKNSRPKLKERIRIEEEVGTRSCTNSPKPKGRIDIKIIYSYNENEYFGMECKRVSSTNPDRDLGTKYVLEGVKRFVEGTYSLGHDYAAMLGFVIDGKVNECINLICDRLNKYKNDICLKEDWVDEQSFGTTQNIYRTRHLQNGQNIMSLLHLFLIVS